MQIVPIFWHSYQFCNILHPRSIPIFGWNVPEDKWHGFQQGPGHQSQLVWRCPPGSLRNVRSSLPHIALSPTFTCLGSHQIFSRLTIQIIFKYKSVETLGWKEPAKVSGFASFSCASLLCTGTSARDTSAALKKALCFYRCRNGHYSGRRKWELSPQENHDLDLQALINGQHNLSLKLYTLCEESRIFWAQAAL